MDLGKTVTQLLVNNLSITMIVVLWLIGRILSLFKIKQKEINPLGWLSGKIGKAITKDVREDVSDLKKDTAEKFKEIKKDREIKVEELKTDYNNQIRALKTDLDGFEKKTSKDILDMKNGTALNCEMLKIRLNEMEASHQKSNDMQTVQTIRSHILDFANSCFNKRRHTKREFENIIDENSTYEELVEKYGIKNNVYKEDYDFILKIYHRCQEEGSFLKEGD
jgi:RNA processing factor Prp31